MNQFSSKQTSETFLKNNYEPKASDYLKERLKKQKTKIQDQLDEAK